MHSRTKLSANFTHYKDAQMKCISITVTGNYILTNRFSAQRYYLRLHSGCTEKLSIKTGKTSIDTDPRLAKNSRFKGGEIRLLEGASKGSMPEGRPPWG